MEITRRYFPMEWEERWRKEKERRRKVMEEGGEKFEEEDRKLKYIVAYNSSRMGLKDTEETRRDSKGKQEEDDSETTVEDQVKIYCRHSYPTEILQTLDDLRQSSHLTDLTLSTEDGLHFQAHSLVMAAVSSTIKQMVQNSDEDRESALTIVMGPEVSRSGLAAMLEFAYTGDMPSLSEDSLAQIQTAAQSLGVLRVLELCRKEEEKENKKGAGGGEEKKKKEKIRKIFAAEQMKITLESMKQLWAERVGCDVELEAEGRRFHAHRVILAASSDYFRGMFMSGMRESQQQCVTLLMLGATELDALLQCSYTGNLTLAWDCIFELACTALQFQFHYALSLCLDFLQKEMDTDNCLDVISFAEAYEMGELHELAEDFVLMHFHEVAATPKFQDLSAEKLLDFLQHDGLSVPSELAAFRAAVTWVQADPLERMSQARELMSGVRFPLMTFREFREVRAINLQMECSGGDEVDLYKSALKQFGFGHSDSEIRRRVRRPREALVLVGGDQLHPDVGPRLPSRQLWFVNLLYSGTGMVKDMEWRKLGEMPDHARFRHGVGVLEDKLYVVGGCHFYAKTDTMKSVYRYTPVSDTWERLADMNEHRSNFTVVVRGHILYAIGGDKDISANLDSVEMYCPDTDSWRFVCPLDQALSGHAATVWGGEIFISGGFNCHYQCLVSMFVYHPENGTNYLSDMNHDRAQHCMENFRGLFYVAGGVCNLRKFYTDQLACEIYNPLNDSWNTFTPLPIPHVGAASAILEEKLYILGGYCQEDYSESRLVHRYDPAFQRWENMGRMPGPTSDLRACLLHLPDHLRK
ncbi:kelch-like protein 33 [Chanos chanos]|uniref:Kelch-like protein 33 n=1 Tax=Chanos chanos TaxID=29144 RepID=A0A6J2VX31_CHACN|nr:kelch-like protein 33 [Chanos chanos]